MDVVSCFTAAEAVIELSLRNYDLIRIDRSNIDGFLRGGSNVVVFHGCTAFVSVSDLFQMCGFYEFKVIRYVRYWCVCCVFCLDRLFVTPG